MTICQSYFSRRGRISFCPGKFSASAPDDFAAFRARLARGKIPVKKLSFFSLIYISFSPPRSGHSSPYCRR